MNELRARLISIADVPEGKQAQVLVLEPNGDNCMVECIVRPTGTEIGGDSTEIEYLEKRYGSREIWLAARQAIDNGAT
jgi:hypothetical protein